MNRALIFFQSEHPGTVALAAKAATANTGERVIVLADCPYTQHGEQRPLCQCGCIAKRFRKTWRSAQGPCPIPFERLCVERWFHVLQAADDEGLDVLAYADSDVAWYANPFSAPHLRGAWDYSLSTDWGCDLATAGQAVLTVEALRLFCRFVLTVFDTSDDPLHQAPLNDMLLWTEFRRRHPQLRCVEQNAVCEGWAFDHNIGLTSGWQVEGARKRITMENGQPLCHTAPGGQAVKMLNLHFWGSYKSMMHEYV